MADLIVALGSNLQPTDNLPAAVCRLDGLLRIRAVSPVYRTPPWGYAHQPDFLNAVLLASGDLPAAALMTELLRIETDLGRERRFPNAPRTLDLDLIDYDGQCSDDPHVILPHPRMHERPFVLVPLCDVAPDWRHPGLRRSARELLSELERGGIVRVPLALPLASA